MLEYPPVPTLILSITVRIRVSFKIRVRFRVCVGMVRVQFSVVRAFAHGAMGPSWWTH